MTLPPPSGLRGHWAHATRRGQKRPPPPRRPVLPAVARRCVHPYPPVKHVRTDRGKCAAIVFGSGDHDGRCQPPLHALEDGQDVRCADHPGGAGRQDQDRAEQAAEWLKDCMRRGMESMLRRVLVKVDVKIGRAVVVVRGARGAYPHDEDRRRSRRRCSGDVVDIEVAGIAVAGWCVLLAYCEPRQP
jgi:hypothetical protein